MTPYIPIYVIIGPDKGLLQAYRQLGPQISMTFCSNSNF